MYIRHLRSLNYGKLKVLDDYDLVIETEDMVQMKSLSKNLVEVFQEEVWIEPMPRKKLARQIVAFEKLEDEKE